MRSPPLPDDALPRPLTQEMEEYLRPRGRGLLLLTVGLTLGVGLGAVLAWRLGLAALWR